MHYLVYIRYLWARTSSNDSVEKNDNQNAVSDNSSANNAASYKELNL